MITYEFEGYVYGVVKTNWGTDIKASVNKDDNDAKYPQHILFSTSKKSQEKLPDDICEGDKIKVTFAPFLSEGVSKSQKVYAINKNMIIDITILEKAEPAPAPEGGNDFDDIPF